MWIKSSLLLILTSIVEQKESYVNIKDQIEHLNNINSQDYVFSAIYDSEIDSNAEHHLKEILNQLKETNTVQYNNIAIELLDLKKMPSLKLKYKLNGRSTGNLFIRNQRFEIEQFNETLTKLDQNLISVTEITKTIENFVEAKLNNISIHIDSIQQLLDLLEEKQVLGIFFGSEGNNYNKYFHVARKNMDFNFAHSHDENVKTALFEKYQGIGMPIGDFFAILRHDSALNEFDDKNIVAFTEFDEKPLTEFIEYERFDKLRSPETANDIVKRMFYKSQPLLLYVKGNKEDSENFKLFKEALKVLPKRMIYSYTTIDAPESASYIQLYTMAESLIVPETLSILWITPSRKAKVIPYDGTLEKEKIKEFIFGFYNEHEHILDSLRQHIYDKNTIDRNNSGTDEL